MNERTYLFVPGNRPERFAKAKSTTADAIVIDLEDAVAADAKPAARNAIGAWMADVPDRERSRIVVRINDAASRFLDDDLALLKGIGPVSLMLPKAESADMVDAVRSVVPAVPVLALIESARGIRNVDAIAEAPGVTRLVFGTLDFALDLGLDLGDSNDALVYGAARLVIASRVAGLAPPVAGVTARLDDDGRLRDDLRWEQRHGFAAKLCIHPRQVDFVHAAMRPSVDELAWARRVMEAAASSPGAASLDGRMIDRPVVVRAEQTLARAANHRSTNP